MEYSTCGSSACLVILLIFSTFCSEPVVAQQDGNAPTAYVYAGPEFTAAEAITVFITFSKPCFKSGGQDGFQCSSTSTCDLLVYGDGEAVPSSLQRFDGGMQYSMSVNLSRSIGTGKVTIAMRKALCSDKEGNQFQRTVNSTAVVRFDRRPVTAVIWTNISGSELRINSQARTLEATNSAANLVIYLNFSSPVLNSSDQIKDALQVPDGTLFSVGRKGAGGRRFAFQLEIFRDSLVVTVDLPSNTVYGRTGLAVEPASVPFLYDTVRPLVKLRTTAAATTKVRDIPVLVDFNEPVFGFNSSGVVVKGGILTSWTEQTKRSYVLGVHLTDNDVTSVMVMENVTADIAGNANVASQLLKIRHYDTPAVSVAISSFITVGLIATALASGTLAISSASLAAAGALGWRTAGSIAADPSRNLLGMATHVQVLALSHWLAVNLPIEYGETVRGLRWVIPNVQLPWEHGDSQSQASVQYSPSGDRPIGQFDVPTSPRMLMQVEGLRAQDCLSCSSVRFRDVVDENLNSNGRDSLPYLPGAFIQSIVSFDKNDTKSQSIRRGRILSANSSVFGPALTASEYELYFSGGTSSPEFTLTKSNASTGWQDFGRIMFWLGSFYGFFIFLHVVTLLGMRWRTKTTLRGALSLPRFELFLLILSLPGLCQASASLIRGGTRGGIVLGVLLLAVPASFFLSVGLFLIVVVFMGALVQYEEFRYGTQEMSWYKTTLKHIVGENVISKWIRREGLAPTFLPRFGLLFEDRKGPPKVKTLQNGAALPRWVDSGANGIGRMRAVDSSEDTENTGSNDVEQILGAVRSAYVLVDIARRILLGVVFGAYSRSARSWSQVSLVFSATLVQLLTLLIFKPFVRRGVQVVETVSMLCELGVFLAALLLLAHDSPSENNVGVGIGLLLLLLISFLCQLVNEWYALLHQLLKLVPSEDTSLRLGLKMVVKGLSLLILPRNHWHHIITPQIFQDKATVGVRVSGAAPAPGPAVLPQFSRELDAIPLPDARVEAQMPPFAPGSPVFIDPRAVVSVGMDDDSGEIKVETLAVPGSRTEQLRGRRKKRSRKSKSKRVSTDVEAAAQAGTRSVSEASLKFEEEGPNVSEQAAALMLQTSPKMAGLAGSGKASTFAASEGN